MNPPPAANGKRLPRAADRTFEVSLTELKLLMRLRQVKKRAVAMLQLDEAGEVVALTILDSKAESL